MEFGYLDDIKYNKMYEAEDKLEYLTDLKERLPETENKYIEYLFLRYYYPDSYIRPYVVSFSKKIADRYIQPGILSHLKQEIEIAIKDNTFDFTDKNFNIFKNYKENMEVFYYKAKYIESIRLVRKNYEKIGEELICKLEKESQRDIQLVTAIWINNKKYSHGIFYEKELSELSLWHLNEEGYYERLGIYSDFAHIWTAENKGRIYKDTLGKGIFYDMI